jgi:hypothetical protein
MRCDSSLSLLSEGNVSALLGLAGAAAESKKQEAEKKELPNTITIADVEEVAVGKEAVKHVEGAKAYLHSVVNSLLSSLCLLALRLIAGTDNRW